MAPCALPQFYLPLPSEHEGVQRDLQAAGMRFAPAEVRTPWGPAGEATWYAPHPAPASAYHAHPHACTERHARLWGLRVGAGSGKTIPYCLVHLTPLVPALLLRVRHSLW
jgi:hypothetical protein